MYEMMHNIGHRPALDPDGLTVDMRFLGLARRILGFVRHEIQIRSEIAKASALDDNLLADIAISRREIKHAVRGRRSTLERTVGD